MKDDSKPIRVVFSPGCFDHLDLSSQEEVDQLTRELTQMFESMTPEELEASSVTMSEEELMEMLSEMDEIDEADSQPAEPTGLMHFPAPTQLQ